MFAIAFFFCYYDYRLLRIKGVDKMSFDLSWFTTISGMFITGGVILLIIALIILLITGRNSKKEKKKKEMELANADGNVSLDSTNVQPVAGQVPVAGNSAIQNNVVGVTQDVNSSMMPAENMVTPVSNVEFSSMSNVPLGGSTGISDTFAAATPMSVSQEPSVMVSEPVAVQSNQSMNAIPETMNSVSAVDFNVGVSSSSVNGFAMPEEPVPVVQSVTPSAMENAPSGPSAFDASQVSIPVIGEPVPMATEPVPMATEPVPMATEPVPMTAEPAPMTAEPVPMATEPVPMTAEPAPMITEPAVQNPVSIDSNPIPVVSATPSIAESTVSTPVVDNPIPQVVVPTVSEVTPQPVEAISSGPVIYGGANPAVTDLNVSRENHQIYGGADPLQNTQTIPTTNPTMSTVPNEPVMVSQQPVEVVPNIVPNVSESTNQGVPPIV